MPATSTVDRPLRPKILSIYTDPVNHWAWRRTYGSATNWHPYARATDAQRARMDRLVNAHAVDIMLAPGAAYERVTQAACSKRASLRSWRLASTAAQLMAEHQFDPKLIKRATRIARCRPYGDVGFGPDGVRRSYTLPPYTCEQPMLCCSCRARACACTLRRLDQIIAGHPAPTCVVVKYELRRMEVEEFPGLGTAAFAGAYDKFLHSQRYGIRRLQSILGQPRTVGGFRHMELSAVDELSPTGCALVFGVVVAVVLEGTEVQVKRRLRGTRVFAGCQVIDSQSKHRVAAWASKSFRFACSLFNKVNPSMFTHLLIASLLRQRRTIYWAPRGRG